MLKHPAVPYVAPFAVFVLFLSLGGKLGLGVWEYPFRVALLSAVIWHFSRRVLDLRMPYAVASTAVGALVFALWIAPDLLVPGWRQHWLLSNSITGTVQNRIPDGFEMSWMVIAFRTIRATIVVPIVEELFWRGWLMRWLINPDFEKVPLGAYTPASFLITAALFASEHGAYWEVGLIAGLIYNAWMIRTKSLGDCILAHAVTNGILSAYVVFAGRWEYWL